MIGALEHRGPDGFGFKEDGPVGLAHARLAIIDLVSGDQPIRNEDGSVWTVFNGEIFNYVELRKDLEARGHKFYTQSDTEVIVHLYEEYGPSFVSHLNGQFAIALWDRSRRRVLLTRDRAGIRPLFYVQHRNRLYFGSEIKSLFALPQIPRAFDPVGLSEVFTFWSAQAPRTVFDGVQSLRPGETMIIEGGTLKFERYWDWSYPVEQVPFDHEDEAAENLRNLLIDSVRIQLRSDVPVGAYLSGGLDSSLVTGIIRHCSDARLRTFSVAFEDAEFDESDHQREMVDYLGTDHTTVVCKTRDIAEALPKVVWHTETPLLRTAAAPLMILSQAVRQAGYKVVLTGEGADEVFGGYDLFKEAKVRRFWAKNPASAMRPLLLDRLYPYLKNSPAASRALSRRFFAEGLEHANEPTFSHATRWRTTQRISQFFSPELKAKLAGRSTVAEFEATLPKEFGSWQPLGRDQYVESRTLLPSYLLASQGDRVCMANSIEGRVPFLDHRLIEFAGRLPAHLKIRGLTEKYLLRKAAKGFLPDSVRWRTKQPYRAPDSPSFFSKDGAGDYVFDLLSESRLRETGLFDPAPVTRLLEKCRTGRAIGFGDNMAFMGIVTTMLVHDQFMRAAAPGSKRFEAKHAVA